MVIGNVCFLGTYINRSIKKFSGSQKVNTTYRRKQNYLIRIAMKAVLVGTSEEGTFNDHPMSLISGRPIVRGGDHSRPTTPFCATFSDFVTTLSDPKSAFSGTFLSVSAPWRRFLSSEATFFYPTLPFSGSARRRYFKAHRLIFLTQLRLT